MPTSTMVDEHDKAMRESLTRQPRPMVLVHGSWLGGWCWSKVAEPLRKQGYQVYVPTMTGVGERRHLMSRLITLDTWVEDILAVLTVEDLTDVVLVGHSFGGRVVTGVVDRMPEQIHSVVFLDSALAESGKSLLDQLSAEARELRIASAMSSDGMSIPPPSPESLGILDANDQAWYRRHASPQPFGTNATAITYRQPIGNGRPVSFVAFTDPLYPASKLALEFASKQANWTIRRIPTGHCAMFSDPTALAATLSELA
jgi:pimeloyl-ACP methyl ester carboxylesterase